MEERLVSCYNVEIGACERGGISGFSGSFYNGGRYLLPDYDLEQWRVLTLFFQKKLTASSGIVKWHHPFFCQSDIMWQDRDFSTASLHEWLAMTKEPFIASLGLEKKELLGSLNLGDELYTLLYRIDAEKAAALALASFLCQSSGIIVITDFSALQQVHCDYFRFFLERSPCCLLFRAEPDLNFEFDFTRND